MQNERTAVPALSASRLALRAGAWYVISQIIARGLTFLTTPIFTRLLTKEEFGVVKVYESWISLLLPVFSLCLYHSIERAKLDFANEFDSYCASVQTLCIMFGAIIAIIVGLYWSGMEKLLSMNCVMLGTLICYMPMSAITISFQTREKQLLRYRSNILVSGLLAIPATLLSVAAVYLLKRGGAQYSLSDARILSFYIPQIAVGAGVAVYMFIKGGFAIKLSHWRYALKFSLPMIPHMLSIFILSQCDKLMIQQLCGDGLAGVFALAVTIQYVLYVIIEAVESAWTPWLFAKLAERDALNDCDRAKIDSAIEKPWLVFVAAAGLASLFITLAAPEIIAMLGGKGYEEAVYIVPPLLVCTMLAFCSRFFISIEKYNKRTWLTAVCTLTVAAINVGLNYAFIRRYGYIAAAYTTAFCYLLLLLAHGAAARLILKEECVKLWKTLLAALAGSVCYIGVIWLYGINGSAVIRYGIILSICALTAVVFRKSLIAFYKSAAKRRDAKKGC